MSYVFFAGDHSKRIATSKLKSTFFSLLAKDSSQLLEAAEGNEYPITPYKGITLLWIIFRNFESMQYLLLTTQCYCNSVINY